MPSGVPRIPEPREWLLTKRCTVCDEVKPWAKFSPRKYWPDGSVRVMASRCHICDSEAVKSRPIPEYRLESVRLYKRDWKRRKVAALKSETVPKHDVLLDPAPFRVWLERAAIEVDGWGTLAELCVVAPRTLHRVMSGESQRVSLSLVDRCLVAMGEHINDLYPVVPGPEPSKSNVRRAA